MRAVGGLIGIATPEKDGLIGKQYAVRSIFKAGLLIDYKVDVHSLYSTTSLIELYIYSQGNIAYYRVLASPLSDGNIIIKYIGTNNCNFKFENNKLYVLPKQVDITIKYKISLFRNAVPFFSSIPISDFPNITGDIITPTID